MLSDSGSGGKQASTEDAEAIPGRYQRSSVVVEKGDSHGNMRYVIVRKETIYELAEPVYFGGYPVRRCCRRPWR